MVQEATVELPSKAMRKTTRYVTDHPNEDNPQIRLKLCLQVNQDVCSDYTEAEIGPSYIKESYGSTTAAIVGIFVTAVVVLLFVGLLFLIYQCRRRPNKKDRSKDQDMDSTRPTKVTPQNQAPPPYYPSTGMENKALEHSMDLALSMDDTKSPRYGSTGGYAYHVPPHTQTHPGQTIPNSDWNMGFIENSYTNSNNGGSVNSQDSLWQMKMQTANSAATLPAHQVLDRQSNYDYDPISHAGYRNIDDYAHYSHLPHTSQPAPPADYDMRATQNPSRQEYCSDPYASVHKPKKRLDQHIESPYHEVSGLPEYGLRAEEGGGEDKPLHMSLGYDESLESGYSTPNSRSRRVIREIIV